MYWTWTAYAIDPKYDNKRIHNQSNSYACRLRFVDCRRIQMQLTYLLISWFRSKQLKIHSIRSKVAVLKNSVIIGVDDDSDSTSVQKLEISSKILSWMPISPLAVATSISVPLHENWTALILDLHEISEIEYSFCGTFTYKIFIDSIFAEDWFGWWNHWCIQVEMLNPALNILTVGKTISKICVTCSNCDTWASQVIGFLCSCIKSFDHTSQENYKHRSNYTSKHDRNHLNTLHLN